MILSIANQKGGCQKSTLNNELALFMQLSIEGAKVCLIDIDIQASLVKQREKDLIDINNDPKKLDIMRKVYTEKNVNLVDIVYSEISEVKNLIKSKKGEGYNIFIIDFPGTIQVDDLIKVYEMVNYIYIPIDCDDKSVNASFEFIGKIEKYLLKKVNPNSELYGYSVFFTLFDNNENKLTNQRFKGLSYDLKSNGIDVLEKTFIKSDYWKNGVLGSTILPTPNIKKYEHMHPQELLLEMINKLNTK